MKSKTARPFGLAGADHRLYMDRVLTSAFKLGRDAIRRSTRRQVGFDGLFDLSSRHSSDCSSAAPAVWCRSMPTISCKSNTCSFQQPVDRHSWYNELGNRSEAWVKRLGWHLLFHRFSSSWY